MVNKPKNIGTAAETAVVRYLNSHGFGQAERSALVGTHDRGDITGTPGVCWEVKAGNVAKTASDGQVAAWMGDTERERKNSRAADFGILVMTRAGIGPDRAGLWWAVLTLGEWATLLDPDVRLELSADLDHTAAVRVHLSTVVQLLRNAGYGDPMLFSGMEIPGA